jgi:branched-chain amino acid aminotransferase
MRDACARLSIPFPLQPPELRAAVAQTVEENGLVDAAVRVTVSRGPGPPSPVAEGCGPSTLLITARPAPPPPARPFRVCTAGRHPQWLIPAVKSLCYFPFQLARTEATARGFSEAVLCAGGYAVEGSYSNLFLVRAGVVHTPDLSSGCLPGITRAAVIEVVHSLGIPLREEPVPLEWLARCDETFLTSSLQGLVLVDELEGRLLPKFKPLGQRIAAELALRVEAERALLEHR